MISSVSILGSTGSIGRQSIAAASHLGIPVKALAANRKIEMVEQQARRLRPEFVAIYDETAANDLRIKLADTDIKVAGGMEGLIEAAAGHAECVVTAVSGSVGLKPTLAAIDAKKRIALANKETLVCAGDIVMPRAAQMGAKISVDSATMMNKGLEFIEAMHLFGVTPDDIQVVVHPQSIIHSMVELIDGTVIAQLGVPDMGLPIQLAMTYPERSQSPFERLDFWNMKDMTFEAPDYEKTPCLKLAMDCARAGGTAPCVMSAANEVAVSLFLQHRIGYNDIYDSALAAVESIEIIKEPDLEAILAADEAARIFVREHFS